MLTQRQLKLNKLFREELAELLLRHLKDPRLHMITINEVRIAPDLSSAVILVMPSGTPEERRESMDGLQSARGHIRSELGKRLKLRRIPNLDFRIDVDQERANHILDLLDKVSKELHDKE